MVGIRAWGYLALFLLSAPALHAIRRVDRRLQQEDEQQRAAADSMSAVESFYQHRRLDVAPSPSSADEHRVTNLPGLDDTSLQQWAGLLPVDDPATGKLFYWLFKADEDPDNNKPLIIWMNGGPGCSSMDGLFLENGPFKVSDDFKLHLNPHSWHKAANTLYIDQPVGTGFSYTTTKAYCANDQCIASNVYTFLQNFFKLHPWLVSEGKTRPVYLTGESQAGHYIPSIASFFLDWNDNKPKPNYVHIDLQGVAIGNGWFDPPTQYDVSEFAHGVGLISQGQLETLQKKRAECVKQLSHGRYYVPSCFNLLDDVVSSSGSDATGQVSLYDYRLFDDTSSRTFPPGYRTVEAYLNKPEVKTAVHAAESPMTYMECTDPPYDALKHQDGLGVTGEIVKLLEKKVRALFFNGVFDVICNHVGNEQALLKLQWSGKDGFASAKRYTWLVPGLSTPGGFAKVYGPLTFLQVLDAGHMVPMSAPLAALDMVKRFTTNNGFVDRAQLIEMTVVPPGGNAGESPATTTDPPPVTPKLKAVEAVDDTTVSLSFEPGLPASTSSLWYTVLANPGGSVLYPEVSSTQPNKLLVKGLTPGVSYSFRLVANTHGGASQPSEAKGLVLACSKADDVCQHGVCGFDDVTKARRCFCYKGYDGPTCSTTATTDAAGTTSSSAAATAKCGAKKEAGRVLYSVSKECEHPGGPPCVLRFTVPFKMCTAAPSSPDFAYLDGPEEIHAFEKMLRRDLAHALSSRREEIVLRSVHPTNSSSSSGSGGDAKALAVPESSSSSSSSADKAVDVFECTFDVLSHNGEPADKVQSFRSLWEDEESTLRYGVVTSNFETSLEVLVNLVSMDAPLSVGEDVRDLPLRKSLLVTAVTIVSFLICLALLARVSKRYYIRSPGMRRGGNRGSSRVPNGGDHLSGRGWSGSNHGGVKGAGLDGDGNGEDEDMDVEIMEIRTSSAAPSLSSSARGALGVGVPGLRVGSRGSLQQENDGATERLVLAP